MNVSRRLALLPLAALAFAGCGGGGEDGLSNRFRGSYTGTYETPNDNGTINFTVSTDGTVTSTVASLAAPGMTGTLTGSVDSSGDVEATITYQNPSATIDLSGTIQRNSNGRILGTLTQTGNGGTVVITFDVTPA